MEVKKSYKSFEYRLSLTRTGNRICAINFAEGKPILEVSSPQEFGGPPGNISPEDMLLGAISACNMTTFEFFAERSKLRFTEYKSEGWALAEHEGNSYRFTQVKLKVTITIPDESQKEVALDAIDKSHRYCLISNSLKAEVEVEPEIIVQG